MTAEQIEAAVEAYSLKRLTPDTAKQFQTYLELLLKWNAKLNLTAIREADAIVQRHFLECIFLAQHLPSGTHTLLDFGSGGGFPGLPIALCRPEVRVTLAESQTKKAAFLREAVRILGVEADIFHGRVEALNREFDAVALRAVDKMPKAALAAQTKVKEKGWLVLFTTEESAIALKTGLAGWLFQPPLRIPRSEQELLLFGQRS